MVICLAKLWENFEEAKTAAIREGAHEKLCAMLQDVVCGRRNKNRLININIYW